MLAGLALLAAGLLPQHEKRELAVAAVRRISEEAEAFLRVAPAVVAEETCRQKSARRRGFRPRIVTKPQGPAPVVFQTRVIRSEFGFAALGVNKGSLHEFRRIMSVDDRKVEGSSEARHKLAAALSDPDDKERLRLLRQFERWSLEGAVLDFSQLILLFTPRKLPDFDFSVADTARVGADLALVVEFRQVSGAGALTVFGREGVERQAVAGRIWVRDTDYLPLRIELRTRRKQAGVEVADIGVVDYAMSGHGALMPASVLHRQFAGEQLVTENLFEYGAFRRFAASSEVKFEVEKAGDEEERKKR